MRIDKLPIRGGGFRFLPIMTQEEYRAERNSLNDTGLCLACGVEADGCEPDMRKGKCDACGAADVYGLEELMVMGLIRWEDE